MKHKQWVGLVMGVMFGISTMLPAQASVLSQSPVVTVTGGHTYSYTYWQEVQTGTQQVQTGTTTQSGYSDASGGQSSYRKLDNSDIMYSPVTCLPSGATGEVVTQDTIFTTVANNQDYFGYSVSFTSASPQQLFPSNVMSYLSTGTCTLYLNGSYITVSTPVYTTEPVYTYEEFTGTAWSPASISY